jgi:hypothetical protein
MVKKEHAVSVVGREFSASGGREVGKMKTESGKWMDKLRRAIQTLIEKEAEVIVPEMPNAAPVMALAAIAVVEVVLFIVFVPYLTVAVWL